MYMSTSATGATTDEGEPLPWPPEFEAVLRGALPGIPDDARVEPDVHLATLGLDSIATLQLLMDIEAGFGITVPDEELTPETFRTARRLWAVVHALRSNA
jgi:acyl carrier protein